MNKTRDTEVDTRAQPTASQESPKTHPHKHGRRDTHTDAEARTRTQRYADIRWSNKK